jgi:sugar-specific transcriptional regulator TrmB
VIATNLYKIIEYRMKARRELEKLVDSLRRLGLTEYEARAYVSLAELGPSTPRAVAQRAKIPHPSAYDALKTLVSKGWAETASSRPTIYSPKSPESIGKETIASLKEDFAQLEGIYRNVSSRTPRVEIIYTVMERDKVLRKMFEMLGRAEESVTLVMPWSAEMTAQIVPRLQDLEKRRVKVHLVTDDRNAASLLKKVRFRKPILAIDLSVDESEALIGLLDYSACGWVDNRFVAAHFREFLDLMWDSSRAP